MWGLCWEPTLHDAAARKGRGLPGVTYVAVQPVAWIRADDLARAMVDVVLRHTQEREDVVFENRDIRTMAESRNPLTNRAG
jgi:hypothetical protein